MTRLGLGNHLGDYKFWRDVGINVNWFFQSVALDCGIHAERSMWSLSFFVSGGVSSVESVLPSAL